MERGSTEWGWGGGQAQGVVIAALLRRCGLLALVGLLLVSGLSGCAWLDVKQRGWIYRPTPGQWADWQPITPQDEALWLALPAAETRLTTPASTPQRLRAVWVPAADAAAPGVLYLHGTFRNLFQNRAKIAAIHAAGFSVLAVDYRGWGESSPLLPSEASIVDDAEVAWAELQRRVPNPAARIIFGHSMGSGAATELALRHRSGGADGGHGTAGTGGTDGSYGALVLESAMTSMPDIASAQGLVGRVAAWLTTQQFASIDKIAAISAPKWFLSGTADNTVPSRQTQQLYTAALGQRQLVLFEGGSHSGLAQEFPARYRAVWQQVAETLRDIANRSPNPSPTAQR